MGTINLGRVKLVNRGTWSSSNTYAIDDFVQYTDTGVVSTYIAVAASTNQTPSTSGTENSNFWKFLAKGVALNVGNNKVVTSDGSGNLQGLSLGSAGQFLRTNTSANGFDFATITQNFVKRTCIGPNTTRYSHSSTGDSGNIWTCSFTKVHYDATSAIYLTWMAPSYGTNSDFSGVYFDIDTGTTHGTDGADAFYGVGYTDNGEQAMHWGLKKVDRSSLDAGNHNVIWGWRARGGGSNRPGNVLNPNNGDDGRIQAKAFYCFIDEILK